MAVISRSPEKSVANNVCLVHSINKINIEQPWNIENCRILPKNNPKLLTRDKTRTMNILATTESLKYKHFEKHEITNEQLTSIYGKVTLEN